MADAPSKTGLPPTLRGRQPLIGVTVREGDAWVIRYFTSAEEANAAIDRSARANDALAEVLKAEPEQSEAEFHEMLDELDRIRHRNPPSPLPEPLP